MPEKTQKPQIAWQPLTFGGVAAFGRASLGRLLLVQGFFGLLAAATVVWCVAHAWFPIVHQAIQKLPSEAQLRSGTLYWHGETPVLLSENRFLAIAVDLNHQGHVRSLAHVQFEFGERTLRIFSLFGYLETPYPGRGMVVLNRQEVDPWWGAWAPPILAIAGGVVLCGSLTAWALLAGIYMSPVRLLGFFADRDLKLGACWRLAGASHMPGTLLLSVAMLFYGLGVLDLLQLLAAALVYLAMSWVYLIGGVLATPRHQTAASPSQNPFATTPQIKAQQEKLTN